MSPDFWVLVGLIAAAIAGVGEAARRTLWPVFVCMRRLDSFLDDWNGEDARPGQPRRPGIPERLAALEDRSKATDGRLAAIEARLGLNDDHA